ncbi:MULTISPECIES: biotin--[acetyl-CoA-carboxylase] ligase [unclassified Campylobacter]|uniref:biotin--[acetyl-CoA-carboxylase] ligase n=1 Tax=unclassified Campylobacter TaxID=2593542 RepID=UPI0022E9E4F8|nr:MULTISPECIES: biotin--[acetyl-CoA-carboxylase] ligase [unclassified Campylobacter]MDA3055448.1 biotin--[acetyl-CoA-carboxylase] ligase [Campylobacter sp. CN_NA1]MDA3064862.1 biotin--[acetyl-CoA-carboxylase] ligase [Campylobacter sp. CN_NE4]MDA3068314.1 biotin--[acetyl-CoA-carboxylase] ligase [Campylobacter sp. CN_NE3]MDA3082373.1 biotin--[acetyl-CoA-carboxylase] ligase [Campylobacter sp. CN_EL2]MDA3084008.1 biotin--[acetyl-CoA-carboxylase] ligase [Campylobacter sp. CN_NE1]
MTIEFVESCDSTQTGIISNLKLGVIKPPYCLVANSQNAGLGSRGNAWESVSGNLYFSFCVSESALPSDLPTNSASIYFAFLMKEYLANLGSKIWLKWPNDFYLSEKKIGGVITTKIKNVFVCGMGLNLAHAPEFAGILDIKVERNSLIYGFFEMLEKKPSWKQIFSKFSLEFPLSQKFGTHNGCEIVSLENAVLCDDGSILINNKKVYSLR